MKHWKETKKRIAGWNSLCLLLLVPALKSFLSSVSNAGNGWNTQQPWATTWLLQSAARLGLRWTSKEALEFQYFACANSATNIYKFINHVQTCSCTKKGQFPRQPLQNCKSTYYAYCLISELQRTTHIYSRKTYGSALSWVDKKTL